MNTPKITIAALLAASIAGGAFAQATTTTEPSTSASPTEAAPAGGDAASTSAANTGDASGSGEVDYNQIITDLQSGSPSEDSTAIAGLSNDATIRTILLSELKSNAADNAATLDEALAAQDAQIADVRAAVEGNAMLSAKLQEEGYNVDDVVAAKTSADNEVTLVIDDTKM